MRTGDARRPRDGLARGPASPSEDAVPVSLGSGPTDDEARLVARARSGDDAAFGILSERYRVRLRRTLFRITGDCDAAQDAVQEALVRAWLNIGSFEGRSGFFTWLTRIGINEV